MKIITSDWKRGEVRLRVENNDDVWHLKNIIDPGDVVTAKTLRHIFIQREGRKEKAERKLVTLTIEVEKVSYHPTTKKLRVTGKIIEGPEDVQLGSYHSIEVDAGSVLTIKKSSWRRDQIERLKKAMMSVPLLLLVSVDLDKAVFVILKNDRLEMLTEVKNPHSLQEERQIEFYRMIVKEMEKFSSKVYRVILAGPGFAKDHVYELIKKTNSELKDKVVKTYCSSASMSGINEILKSGVLDKVLKESRIMEEIKLIEDFFKHIGKDDGLACYGYDEVKMACEAGAVDTLLVSEEKIREGCVEKLAKSVEEMGGKVEVISKDHEMGERFYRMGGIGAILRFKYKY